jgi:hypothetical protein
VDAAVTEIETVIRRLQGQQSSPAPAKPNIAHRLTDAELADPEYVRGYVDECFDTIAELRAPQDQQSAPTTIKFQTADEYLSERNGAASEDWINGFTACRNAAIKACQSALQGDTAEPPTKE